MKAVVCTKYGPSEVLQLTEVEKPVPRENEVLIKVHAATVTPADIAFRKGDPFISRLFTGLLKPKFTPGDELAGEIEAVGKSVKGFKKGDKVFGSSGTTFGAHAEYICLPEDAALGIMPDSADYAEAVAVCYGGLTALPFLRDKASIKRGQKVLINGASGAIGTLAVQLARYYGAEVTGVCSTANLELVRSLGAERVIDYTKEDFAKAGQTYDIIFDVVAKSSFPRCKSALRPDGIYLITFPSPGIMVQSIWTSKFGRKKAMFQATGLRPAREKSKDLLFLKEITEAGKLKPVIDRRYPLEQIAEAHIYVEEGHKKGNVIITF
ncbi:NAD(P)-dependent alcohol dehydrogenase [uncultured Methanomethylovorans sp.]|uniref:NAD(P)-dependent alcohol dehydrogenase n=1 Tax=uncultured Methanomethylovorans sp. TaxID=183759 RepID=UPI0026230E5C|nr:NAD(P)-dependent alcohol dehydrogenase [uncultured Methanomethylovorans sp.]